MSRIDSESINLGESFVLRSDIEYEGRFGAKSKSEENKLKALSIIEQAQEAAKNIIEQAKLTAEQEAFAVSEAIKEEAKQEGYKEGYEQGYQDGIAKINEESSEKITLFNNFVESAFDIKKRIIKSLHLEIVAIVSEISQKICQKKLEIDDEVLLNMTKAAIGLLKEKETITIIANPQMRDAVMQIAEQIKNQNSLISNIKIVENVSVSSDGTIVEGLTGRVDSRISSQIDEIVQKLMVEVQVSSEEELVIQSETYLKQLESQSIQTVEDAEIIAVEEYIEPGD